MKVRKRNVSPYRTNRFLSQVNSTNTSLYPEFFRELHPRQVAPEKTEFRHLKDDFAGKIILQRNELEKQNGQKKRCWGRIFIEWAKKYCESTTLHGFKYMAEQDSRLPEKTLWFFLVTAMFFGAVYVVLDQVMKFLQSPTLISFAQKQTSVNTLPFPAITICPHAQLKKSYYNMSWGIASRNNFSEVQDKLFHLIIDWCGMFKMPVPGERHIYKTEDFHYLSNAINSYFSCLDFLPFLTWAGYNTVLACEVAQPITTELGACFAFNMLPLDQILSNQNTTLIQESWATKFLGRKQIWSPDTGYTAREDGIPLEERTPPWSPLNGGIFNSIHFLMQTNRTEFDQVCTNGGKGFTGIIHNPAELPLGGQSVFYADEGKMLFLQVQPKIYTLDPRLEAWSPKQRGCYMQDERELSFFKFYTQRNCETECAANLSLVKCGCAAYYHPRLRDTPVCGPQKIWCLSFTAEETAEDMSCDCMPSCSDLEYVTTMSITMQKDWPKHIIDYKHNPKEFAYSLLCVKFHGRFVQAIQRSIMFGPIELIGKQKMKFKAIYNFEVIVLEPPANTGGLLGLFLGFSLLSLVEFIYFITFKFWCLLKKM